MLLTKPHSESPPASQAAPPVVHPHVEPPRVPEVSRITQPGTEELILTPDDPSNTTITDADSAVLYTVRTVPGGHDSPRARTEVRNADGEIIASLEWHGLRPDKVTLAGQLPMSMSEWMHRSLIPFDKDVTFKDVAGRKYKWKGNELYKSLELYSEDTHYARPIAKYLRPHHGDAETHSPTTEAILQLTPRALEVRDDIVVAFLFLEKTRRNHEEDAIRENKRILALPGKIGGVP